ncbi:MAG: putative ATP-dependent protease [Paracoccaceae bacterium]|jgi:predicted ATP-dependent protease
MAPPGHGPYWAPRPDREGERRNPLDAALLRRVADPAALGFATTDNLAPMDGLLGQDRATDAIRLSARIGRKGFNLFVLGPKGAGRRRAVDRLLTAEAARGPVPCDWVYVNNCDAPEAPRALQLPAGIAAPFKAAMAGVVDDLSIELPALFDAEDYQTCRRAMEQSFGERHEGAFSAFSDRAKSKGVAVMRTPVGFALVALKDGAAVEREAFAALPKKEQARLNTLIERLQQQLADLLKHMPAEERAHRREVEKLHAELAERAVGGQIAEIAAQFKDVAPIIAYLDAVRADMIANADLFLSAKDQDEEAAFPDAIAKVHAEPEFRRYGVNVMVSQAGRSGAPLEREALPSMANLTGRIEHIADMGALVTDFMLIKPGALHRANGGYLVLDAARVLAEPFAWEALKRCLDAGEVSIASMADRLSLVSTISLNPDPIPVDVRVVLVGDRQLHALLMMLDPDFPDLFKVQADFADEAPRTDATQALFARLIGAAARAKGLRALTCAAVARLIDEAARMAEDAERMSLKLGALIDIMSEADFYAAPRDVIDRPDVVRALAEAEHRASRIAERSAALIARGIILIETDGTAVGQINALSVIDLGAHRFGRPMRITARVRMGAGEVVDIEREVDLGGPLHFKGVMILSGYLSAHYARDAPLSLHASVVFEQSYGGVDGDSASSAELYALLSALADVPLRQDLAVTGSVNQLGEVQAIGGVNEKIEGFFDICAANGLTGRQGVLIPAINAVNLMLREDVVAAARAGRFHIHPITRIDEGLSLLTGRDAGVRGKRGSFPKGSVNGAVEARMRGFAALRRDFARPPVAKKARPPAEKKG